MKHGVIIAGGLALFTVAAVLLFANGGGKDAARASGSLDGGAARKSPRDAAGYRESGKASKALRLLIDAPSETALLFDEIESLARKLSHADLEALIAEVGVHHYEGMPGWVRSALAAEWARRDPHAAITWVETMKGSAHAQDYALQQAWFGIFRGWAETDPLAAHEAFQELEMTNPRGRGDYWRSYAHTNIVQDLSRRDPSAAWAALPTGDAPNADALTGFFRGLESKQTVDTYAAKWAVMWASPEAEKRQRQFSEQMRSGLSGAIATPPEEIVGKEVALAMARIDVELAREFLLAAGPGNAADRRNRLSGVLDEWARRSPERALELAADPGYKEWQTTLARGIIAADPAYAVQLMETIESHGVRSRALLTGLSPLGGNHVRDFFPVPGERHRLPDFEARYDAMLDAVEAGRFEDGQKRILLKNVHREFRNRIPAAKEAYERATKR